MVRDYSRGFRLGRKPEAIYGDKQWDQQKAQKHRTGARSSVRMTGAEIRAFAVDVNERAALLGKKPIS
jgi:hypothetical protein